MTLVRVSEPAPLRSEPAAVADLATGVRGAGENVSDTQSDLAEGAMPADWEGSAAEAASHRFTTVSTDLDVVVAALSRASTLLTSFEEKVQDLQARRRELTERVLDLNHRIDEYDRAVASSDREDEAAQEALIGRSAALEREADDLQGRVDAFARDQDAAEDAVIAGLRGADSVAEGAAAAGGADRPDAAALTRALHERIDSGDPASVTAWWRSLSIAQQQSLILAAPQLVGNADGVPATARDQANRASVASDLDELGERERDGTLSDREQTMLENARSADSILQRTRQDVDPVTGHLLTHLLVYRPDAFGGDGGLAVSRGNPDTADDVSAFVPGLTSEASSAADQSALDAQARLHDEVDRKNGDDSTATITWIDYDAPSSTENVDPLDYAQVAGEGKAEAGGQRFSDFVAGLRASDEGPPAHLTAIGHSYGSTTVAHAATDTMMDVDTMVLLGSPGVGSAEYVTDLMPDGEVYVGSADHDPVTLLGATDVSYGPLGRDPAQESFGAHRFEVDPGSYRLDELLTNHGGYFRSEPSVDAISDLVAGVEPDEVDGRTPGSYQTLDTLLAGSTTNQTVEDLADELQRTGEGIADGASWTWDRVQDAGRRLSP